MGWGKMSERERNWPEARGETRLENDTQELKGFAHHMGQVRFKEKHTHLKSTLQSNLGWLFPSSRCS